MRKAWHFLREDKRLGYGDGRLVEVGQTLTCDPNSIKLCHMGFHGSGKLMDALKYAPGPIVCRVELSGKIIKGDDKYVASERTVIKMADATNVLHEFACLCAEDALKLVKNPDPQSVAAIEAKRKWLRGEITDKELYAAKAAAGGAAWLAARAAVSGAPRDAARAAEWAAMKAAREAVWAAARDAAGDAAVIAAAKRAAMAAQNKRLTRMVNKLFDGAKGEG